MNRVGVTCAAFGEEYPNRLRESVYFHDATRKRNTIVSSVSDDDDDEHLGHG